MAVDQRKIDKMSSERVTPGNELGDLTEVQNQVNAVNAERMNNLAQERIESQSVQETNTNLRTAVEIATDDSGNVVQQPQRTSPALVCPSLNPNTILKSFSNFFNDSLSGFQNLVRSIAPRRTTNTFI